jgi:hypothetical protein
MEQKLNFALTLVEYRTLLTSGEVHIARKRPTLLPRSTGRRRRK